MAVPEETVGATEETDKAALRRAEELVDQLGERMVHYGRLLGSSLARAAARAREEVQDIWADAQHIRNRGRS
jgi:NH3-dependent NAD+ synthetase